MNETAVERLTDQLSTLRSGIDVADSAADVAGRKLDAARRALLRAQAVELRGEAERLDQDADKRQKRNRRMAQGVGGVRGRGVQRKPDLQPDNGA